MSANRQDRQNVIVRLIGQHNVAGQDQLRAMLLEAGFDVTQATLSRDIKALQIVKSPDGQGGYRYAVPAEKMRAKIGLHGVVSIEVSGQMAVVKTRPGYASAVASDIDASNVDGVMGTIAGDDTVLIALRSGVGTRTIETALQNIFN